MAARDIGEYDIVRYGNEVVTYAYSLSNGFPLLRVGVVSVARSLNLVQCFLTILASLGATPSVPVLIMLYWIHRGGDDRPNVVGLSTVA